ncbi:NADP-dependent oxidoreductase domain,Aldo/keto reductase, conserved site,Aldo/keto reductase [Cinara cedri]|uniref:NADP-dependent oxidoreductase domain,Aldo/keto reductase, conserved site,Aldo/keto reductase n=1 Tax=Cinara cedri TaxID=506608 RepID=A0A5E4M7Y4_9HEMI|nr:NADP-dependent oxidoreductase domain,Aldo/keto reductase, conserved site,Aldo/keto reductase [Cinara cedri]
MKYLKLNFGGNMPIVGYGTWLAKDSALIDALNEALNCGYRHIDTATAYENEHVIGKVLNEWIASGKGTRDELFIVTKLPPYANRASDVEECLKKSLQSLQLDYVDLYLVHTPFSVIATDDKSNLAAMNPDNTTDHLATWKVMEKQVSDGRTKAIGVSNFNIKQIQRLLNNCLIKPANLQIEHHLYLQQPELVDFCRKNDITVTAYSCLGTKGNRDLIGMKWSKELPEMLENDSVLKIAEKHGKSPAQVILRYIVQKDVAVIPKSTNPQRLAENIQIFDFELDAADVETLREQDAGEGGRIVWFEFFKGISEHPEYPFSKEA